MSYVHLVRIYANDPNDPDSKPDILCAEARIEYDEHVKKRVVVEHTKGDKVFIQALADKMPLIAGRKSRVSWRYGPRPSWIKAWKPPGARGPGGGSTLLAVLSGFLFGSMMDDD